MILCEIPQKLQERFCFYTVRLVLLKLAQFRASRSYEGKGDVSGSIRCRPKWIGQALHENFWAVFVSRVPARQQTCFLHRVMITLEMKEKFVCKALLRALRSTPRPQFRAIKRARRRK